ncbi:Crp/Fnr family transcriptional regulator [Zhouia spongiae]|uniref:Crp/Fnr family transcriptional regulator n=1 Tax=Zhouia spongiae TaxID=2202721 RepID=A0ABY3YNR2_9FLAO|nr:Crp/Fnr family transcriptional regulator [Zhouia spongiae]UNY99409.1 Crp/Fnr family transcriptional regulator [Zhouia spongiae]
MIRKNLKLLQYLIRTFPENNEHNISVVNYHPGEIILDQNKRVYSVHIVKKGIVKCYLTEDNGNDFIQEFFGDGELFGEVEVIKGGLSFCKIEAITPVEVFLVSETTFTSLLETNRQFNRLILEALTNKIQYKAIRHAYNQSHTIEDKLIRLQNEFPQLFRKISKSDIANYLGITIRSLNRTLNAMDS